MSTDPAGISPLPRADESTITVLFLNDEVSDATRSGCQAGQVRLNNSIAGFVGRDYYLRGQGMKTAHSADRLARDTLKAISRNKALLVKPKQAYASWLFARLAPGLLQRMSIRFIADQRKRQAARLTASR